VTAAAIFSAQAPIFPVLKNSLFAGPQKEGFSLLVTNQILRPWGDRVTLAGRPVEGVMDPAGRFLAVLNLHGIDILDAVTLARVGSVATKATSYGGIAFRPGTSELWACESARSGEDALIVATLGANGSTQKTERLRFPEHPVPAGAAFSPDGKLAYVSLSANDTVAVVDASEREILREIPVGIAPMAIAVSKQTGQIFVANRGGRRPQAGDASEHVAYSAHSEVVTDAATGSTASGSLTLIDPRAPETPHHFGTGLAPAVVTISPDGSMVAIANAHSDSVTVFDSARMTSVEVKIPSYPDGTFGSQPVSAAFSSDGKRLFVACGGINALAVLDGTDARNWHLAGMLPTGWFPVSVAVADDGSVRVVSLKGVGNNADQTGGHNSRNYEGAVSSYPPAMLARLDAGTREVRAGNAPKFEPAGGVANLASLGIRHVFLIIKENRTYDQVLSDLPRGERDSRYLMYGRDVTPNHHALAEQFVLLDNFYTSSAISFDGHQWLMMAFVSDYVERSFASSPRGYSWNMDDALTVAPTGFFWQGAPRPLDVKLMGELTNPAQWDSATQTVKDINESDLPGWAYHWNLFRQGRWREASAARPAVPALAKLVATDYPTSTMNITDQIRAEAFLAQIQKWEKAGNAPEISVVTLTEDHTMGKSPEFPTPKAMVADDDLALGRMVEGLSKSKFWAQSLVLVTEDDAQDGVDHVDGHRTICLAIGPHVRRAALDSTHYNHTSVVRTMQEIFRIPPRTRFLATARPMTSIFQAKPDLTPYAALRPAIPLDQMNPPLHSLSGRPRAAALASMRFNPNHIDDIPSATMNRILWWEAKGYSVPYPERASAKTGATTAR
jgi:YVTN family beta-propeller protein